MTSPIMLWPPQASHYAREVDLLIGSFGVLVILLTLPVFILGFVFAVRYRRGRDVDRTHPPERSVLVETSWSVIPFILIIGFYVWSTTMFASLQNAPPNALVVDVTAKQWMWRFQHQEGAREINELHVPTGRPVRLVMTSEDVIHSLFIPALRIKQDVLPDRYTALWFNIDKPGIYALRCSEYCGTDHSLMTGQVVALTPQNYSRWLQTGPADESLEKGGERLFRTLGCSGCHTVGSSVHAPSLANLYGSPVPLSDGRIVVADRQYIHDSIMLPNKDVAKGYAPIMPTYGNLIGPEEVAQLEAYVISLRGRAPR